MFSKPMSSREYERASQATRDKRMEWWRQARFGMFVHFGPYAALGRHEWAMAVEGYSVPEYEKAATDNFHPKKGCAREWAKLAHEAGCKYMTLTTRHHDGFSLWDSKTNPYNIVGRNGGHDIVAEYVAACREFGLKIGLYHSVMDWHNPDGAACMWDMEARLRFIDFHRGMLKELMANYGKIDILWYDCATPMKGVELDFAETNRMVRQMQPDIIINSRSGITEDFGTPESHITAEKGYWEACMTFNDLSWGYIDSQQATPYSYNAQRIIRMISTVTAGGGNLLLNIGPAPDGSLPAEAVEPLKQTGKWLGTYANAVYGEVLRVKERSAYGEGYWINGGNISLKDKNVYLWEFIIPKNGERRICGIMEKVVKIRGLADGREYKFTQEGYIVKIQDYPAAHTDPSGICSIFEIECEKVPTVVLAPLCKPLSKIQNPEEFDFRSTVPDKL